MPGPKTHEIFYKQLKAYLHDCNWFDYDACSIYAQGHDLLIYYDFYKIHTSTQLGKNVALSKRLQEYSFCEFVYCYLKYAEKAGILDNEQVRLFIGPGYIGHHILDAYTHPLIIYLAGDHERDVHSKTWQHGVAENLIDIYLMNHVEKIDSQNYPVYKDFIFPQGKMAKEVRWVLNKSLQRVYGIEKGGDMFEKACSQVEQYMRLLQYDPKGKKSTVFDKLDLLLKGTSSFSYGRSEAGVEVFLNDSHEIWRNPMDGSICSQASFMELYQRALIDCAQMIKELEQLCKRGDIHRSDIRAIIPDIASTHGLPCGKTLEIKYTKEAGIHEWADK